MSKIAERGGDGGEEMGWKGFGRAISEASAVAPRSTCGDGKVETEEGAPHLQIRRCRGRRRPAAAELPAAAAREREG